MTKVDVLKVVGEPVAIIYSHEIIEPKGHGRFVSWLKNPIGIPNDTPLYTEAQLLAMYAKGAEDMRERTIPEGWRFSSADFSLQAAGKGRTGSVTLIRSPDMRALWHKQDDAIKDGDDCPELYVYGKGESIYQAMSDAVDNAIRALPITTNTEGD